MALFVTYNVLAEAYAFPDRYPGAVLEGRGPRLVERVLGLKPDVVCLQEVEEPLHQAFCAALSGWTGLFAKKRGRAPDGCALYSRLPVVEQSLLYYGDGTGHLAQLAHLRLPAGGEVVLANTHLRWDVAGELALAQMRELLAALGETRERWVICGDFNVEAESATLELCRSYGLADALGPSPTAVTGGRAKKLDYMLHGAGLTAGAGPVAVPTGNGLPDATEPSDHLPGCAWLE